ncbi:MAG: condensation domain-containing protein, partial [Psychrosphaera sp.]|nr:condensation domain-containing protein [Psychrosphaera sp.]
LEHDLSHLSHSEQLAQLDALRHQDKIDDFAPLSTQPQAPLMRMTLVKISADAHQLLWTHHHALLDGWCMRMVFKEVIECYRALQMGETPVFGQVMPYRHYAVWLAQQNRPDAEAFWQAELQDINGPTPLPLVTGHVVAHVEGNVESKEPQTISLHLSESETAQLTTLAQSTGTTMNVLLQGAWALLLSRYSGEQKVVFGAVTSGRPGDLVGVEDMVGLFINTLPVVVAMDSGQTVAAYLQQVHQQLVAREAFGYLPLSDIQRLSAQPQGLFDSLLIFENYPEDDLGDDVAGKASLQVKGFESFEGTNYDMTLTVHATERLHIKLDIQAGLLTPSAAAQLAAHLRQLLLGFAVSGQTLLPQVAMLSNQEVNVLLNEHNKPLTTLPMIDQCPHQLFEAQVALYPQQTALIFEGQSMSYQTLNQ